MPFSAPRPCTRPGCRRLVRGGGPCAEHLEQRERARGNSNERGYTWRWRKASQQYRREHPLCECDDCRAGEIRVRASAVVDHRVPHRGDPVLFWDRSNWMAMAAECHNRKTAREDGGFGRA